MARAKDLKRVLRGCKDRELSRAIASAMKDGTRYRMTKGGIMLYGHNGHSASIHFTVSDSRGPSNIWMYLKKIGVIRKEK